MSRITQVCLAVIVLGVLALCVLAYGGIAVLPAYRAAWLIVLSLPLGALPIVMGLDGVGLDERIAAPSLRALLALMPLAALLAIPLLIGVKTINLPGKAGFAETWMAPGFVVARTIVFLVVWTVLAARFRHAARGARPGLAIAGLAAHLVMSTIFAVDWIGMVEPGFPVSSLGLILILAQCGLALSAACLLAVRSGQTLAPETGVVLAVLFGAWMFVQFTQYLVVWSANLPAEIPWYVARGGGFFAGLALLAFVLTLWAGIMRSGSGFLAIVAGLVLLVHAAEMFWLVTPTSRGRFTLSPADILALIVMGGAVLLWPRSGRLSHGDA